MHNYWRKSHIHQSWERSFSKCTNNSETWQLRCANESGVESQEHAKTGCGLGYIHQARAAGLGKSNGWRRCGGPIYGTSICNGKGKRKIKVDPVDAIRSHGDAKLQLHSFNSSLDTGRSDSRSGQIAPPPHETATGTHRTRWWVGP